MNKPTIYAEIPSFDQQTQGVYQMEPVDMGEYIFYGVEVRDLPPDDGGDMDFMRMEEAVI